MQLDNSAEHSTSSRIYSSGKTIDHYPTTPDLLESGGYIMRNRSVQLFLEKGWKPRKIFQEKNLAFIMLTRPNSAPVVLIWEQDNQLATVFNGPDSKYHTPQEWKVFNLHQPARLPQPQRVQEVPMHQPRRHRQRLQELIALPRLPSTHRVNRY